MGIEIINNKYDDQAVLTCNTTEVAFGPVIRTDEKIVDEYDCELMASELAKEFVKWLPRDARQYEVGELNVKYTEFLVYMAARELEKI